MTNPDTPEITERDFIVPIIKDKNGHDARIFARVSPVIAQQIDLVVASKFFPYRTGAMLIRHAIHNHLRWLEGLASVKSVMAQVDAIDEILREDEFNKDSEERVKRFTKHINEYLENAQVGRAQALLARVLEKIEQMPDGEWKDLYRQKITNRFGPMLQGDAVSLLGEDEEGGDAPPA